MIDYLIETWILQKGQPNILSSTLTLLRLNAKDETHIETWILQIGQPNILVPYLNYDWFLAIKVTLKHEFYK